MAGIYIHIPFCKKACTYCDFHFSISDSYRNDMVEQIVEEIKMRSEELKDHVINTIYFGGGTPSIISADLLKYILDTVKHKYDVSESPEITIECNPDDLSLTTLESLRDVGFNRLSIGIQTFDSEILNWMGRSHNSEQAIESVLNASKVGFENMSIDLIYGIPDKSTESWLTDLDTALSLPVQHISAYCLTVEPKTLLAHWVKKGEVLPLSDSEELNQFQTLIDVSKSRGFFQYEVSNFAREGFESRHNSSYWEGIVYCGFGPSAHSFDGKIRSWNVNNNAKYMRGIKSGNRDFDFEKLSENSLINERIMTGLRTVRGVDLKDLKKDYGFDLLRSAEDYLNSLKRNGEIEITNNRLILTPSGLARADKIASDLFVI